MTIAVLVSITVGTNISLADSTSPPAAYVPSQRHIIVKQAQYFAAPADEILNVGHCESGHADMFVDQSEIGQAGEIGAFQYFQSTWDGMSKAMGEKLDIHSFDDQARLTAWVFAHKPSWKKQWSTWRYWYGEGHRKCHP